MLYECIRFDRGSSTTSDIVSRAICVSLPSQFLATLDYVNPPCWKIQ